MKQPYLIIIFFNCAISLSYAMEESPDFKSARTVAFITENIVAVGADKTCFLIYNPTSSDKSIKQLYTHIGAIRSLITNKKNYIGILGKDSFFVYDVINKEKIWSQSIYHSNYSAALGINNTIFLCQNDHLISNTGINIQLPHFRNEQDLNITCHPIQNKLLYLGSPTLLIEKSFDNDQKTLHYHPEIEEDDSIYRAFYSPNGNCIAVHTNKKKLYLYYPSDNKTILINKDNYNCYRICNHPLFLPQKDCMVFLCKEGYIHYFNIKKTKGIGYIKSLVATFTQKNMHRNFLEFSPQGTQFAISLNDFYSEKNPLYYLVYISFILKEYSLQNNYYLPSDIINLLVRTLYNLFPFTISH